MNILTIARVITALLIATSAHAFAADADPSAPAQTADAANLAAFAQRFKAANPNTRIDSISTSTIAGLFEVVMGKNVAYVEPSGRYALFGHIFDMQERRDLTADRKASLDKVDLRSLPTDLALRHVKGNGSRVLYVFSDPQCGFCKALEKALVNVDDITVYTFLTPILGPESKRLANAVWCSTSPAQAWSAWMLKGHEPSATTQACAGASEALASIGKLAQSLDVAATPTLVAGDGRKAAGAMSAQQLTAWLGAQAPLAATPALGPSVQSGARTATAKTSAAGVR